VRARRAVALLVPVVPLVSAVGCDLLLGYDHLRARDDTADVDVSDVETETADQDAAKSDAAGLVDGPVDAADASACVKPVGGDACQSIPAFTGKQVIDGYDDDFCGIPATQFPYTSGVIVHDAMGPPILDAGTSNSALIRVGWSMDALHLFIHVHDPEWVAPSPGVCVATCSEVEIYLAAPGMLTGTYTGTNDGGATQILFSAPPSTAVAFYTGGQPIPIDPSLYASVVTNDGYNVELQFPWPALHAEPIISGARVALDFAFDVQDVPDAGREYQAIYGDQPVDGGASQACGSDPSQPWCDDRTWCTPRLQ
jgi:hypothetical protein